MLLMYTFKTNNKSSSGRSMSPRENAEEVSCAMTSDENLPFNPLCKTLFNIALDTIRS